ncbi:MAG TPA: BTAD domain-containing putative transcriptional regulator [Acidimicrobiales bacterium]|nr:BTAD domain-containing putative transcriptional regulator [Acidimicrobiales bacterium]
MERTPKVDDTGLAGVRVLVLGPLVVEDHRRGLHVAGSHRRRLLAFLASRAGRVASVDAIADALWGDRPPATMAKSIQNHVARLRASFTSLDGELIETTPAGYRLAVRPEAVDAVLFEHLAGDGRRRLAAGDAAGAVDVLTEALSLWRGAPYTDLADAEFAQVEVARLEERRRSALEDLAEGRLESGMPEQATADLGHLVAEQPGRERAWGLLMRALFAAGRQRDALDAYQRARRALADEFGLEPGPELRDLERRILEQDPTLTVRRTPAVPAALRRRGNPFVGRERELAWLADGWRAASSGSGQVRLLLGPVDSGRTRLAGELAATAVAEGGQVLYVQAADGFEGDPSTGAVVDGLVDRTRAAPLLVVVDDAEWASASTMYALAGLAGAVAEAPMLVLLIADPSADGAALQALRRLDREGARTLEVPAMDDGQLAAVLAADGIDGEASVVVAAIASGLPGAARREAAAWSERAASERLTLDSVSSVGVARAATIARTSVFDDMVELVAARARRDELSSTWAGRQPYRSLAAYDPQDADLFVGRERLVAALAARVLGRRLVAVVGGSGSGKSSLVRAGLVPLVRSGRLPGAGPWRTAVIVPGTDPIGALDAVERLDDPGPFLVVVDQFEEAFGTGVADEFATRLVELAGDDALDVHVVVVIRADQFASLAAVRPLAAGIEDAQVLVGPPSEDELRRIVEVPARRTGCTVEPELSDRIGEDVAGHDATLPLLSAALAEVWEARIDDRLTLECYLRHGGLAAAVQRMGARAVAVAGEGPVRDAMLRLVDVTGDGQWVRRRLPADQVPAHLSAAFDALVDARVVQRGEAEVDVVHEVVFGAWPQLAGWLEEVRAELVLHRDLRAASRSWEAGGRSDDDLYRGARLAAASELVASHGEVEPLVSEFVEASRREADRAADERARHQAVAHRRLRRMLSLVAGLLVVALVASALAVRQTSRSTTAAAHADARRVGAQALATTDPNRALLLAVGGVRLDDAPETRANLAGVLARHAGLVAPQRSHVAGGLAPSIRGDRLVAYDGGRLVLVDAATSAVLARSKPVPPVLAPSDVTWSLDEHQIAVAHLSDQYEQRAGTRKLADRPIVLYDGRTLDELPRQLGGVPPLSAAQSLAYSADGRMLAVTLALFRAPGETDPYSTQVLVWDLRAPGAPVASIDPGAQYDAVALSPDGKRLYAAVFPPGGIRAYDTATGNLVGSVGGIGGRMAASDDGGSVALTGLLDGQVVVLDAATLHERARFHDPEGLGGFLCLAFSHDGALVAVPNPDSGALDVWDVATGALAEQQVGFSGNVTSVWFAPDDRSVHALTDTGTTVGWDLGQDHRFVPEVGPPAGLAPADLAMPVPGGPVAYVSGTAGSPAPGGTVQLRDLASNRLGPVVDLHHKGLWQIAWRADRRRFASSGMDGAVRVWDAGSGRLLVERRLGPDEAAGVAYTSGGRRLVVTEGAGTVFALDAETLAPAGPTIDLHHELGQVFPDPEDRFTVVVSNDVGDPDEVDLIDTGSGRVLRRLHTGFWSASEAVSPDGGRLVVTGTSGDVRLFDLRRGRWTGGPTGSAHGASVTSAAWSADGSTVVTGSLDGQVSVWDAATGALAGSIRPGPPNVPVSAVFEGRSSTVLAAAADGSLFRWDTDPRTWIRFACTVAGRNLTRAEWHEAFGHRPYRTLCP